MKRGPIRRADYISIDPEICIGKPRFKGSRVMVADALTLLEAGDSFTQIKTSVGIFSWMRRCSDTSSTSLPNLKIRQWAIVEGSGNRIQAQRKNFQLQPASFQTVRRSAGRGLRARPASLARKSNQGPRIQRLVDFARRKPTRPRRRGPGGTPPRR